MDGIRKDFDSIEAFMGKCVHSTLEWLYLPQNRNRPYITFDHICRKFDDIWRECWHDKIFIVDPYLESDHYYAIGKRCLSNYYNKYGPIFDQKVYATELELEFTVDEKYKFKGIIDRLDNPSEGVWVIHDYKSGKRALSQNMAKKDLQLVMYQIAVMQNFEPVNQISLKWHFLQKNLEVTVTHELNEMIAFHSKLKKKVSNIIDLSQDLANFYPTETILCNWCYLWEECSAKMSKNPARQAI